MNELFRSLEMHDVPVTNITIDFANEVLVIIIRNHDDIANELFEITLRFIEVKNLSIGQIDLIDRCEITNCDVIELAGETEVSFDLLCGHPVYPVNLSFSFKNVVLEFPEDRIPNYC